MSQDQAYQCSEEQSIDDGGVTCIFSQDQASDYSDSQLNENPVVSSIGQIDHKKLSEEDIVECSGMIEDANESDEMLAESPSLIEECRTPTPEILFNKEEYIQIKTESLERNLCSAGFMKSDSMIEIVDEGDQCLLNLLDQMKREDQDFKVWERDDYTFLRWYVTRQMETLFGKVENLKFVESIEGDFYDYINRMSQDGVPIDRTFIQAAATIFNKDIILIPAEEETEYDVVTGGLNNGKNKGIPLYLGHIKKAEECPDIFVSIMPDKIDNEKVSNILSGNLKLAEDTPESCDNEISEGSLTVEIQDDYTSPATTHFGVNQWSRMDSFNGSSAKIDTIINDIISGENLDELFKQADSEGSDDDEYEDEFSECDTVGTIHENDQWTPEASDINLYESLTKGEISSDFNTDANIPIEDSSQKTNDNVAISTQSLEKEETKEENPESQEDDDQNWVYDEESGYWIIKEEATENTPDVSLVPETESKDFNNNSVVGIIEKNSELESLESNSVNQPSDSNSNSLEDSESFISEEDSQNQFNISNDQILNDSDHQHKNQPSDVSEKEYKDECSSVTNEEIEGNCCISESSSVNNDHYINENIELKTEEEAFSEPQQKTRQLKRKIKISVSVSGDDQVNCDFNISSDPVPLDQSEYLYSFYLSLNFFKIYCKLIDCCSISNDSNSLQEKTMRKFQKLLRMQRIVQRT